MAARFDLQKGYELVKSILLRLNFESDINFQFISNASATDESGERILSDFKYLQEHTLNGKLGIINPYNKELTHLVYAGSDASLAPSSYEPCGLVVPCSMINGTIPIGRAVGGMIDIINDGENGFLVSGDWPSSENDPKFKTLVDGFIHKIKTVNKMMKHRESDLNPFIESMMQQDLSWTPAANKYIELYREMVSRFEREGHYNSFGAF